MITNCSLQVFADHETSHNPINVPRSWLWKLKRRTVYFGTSVPSIFKGKIVYSGFKISTNDKEQKSCTHNMFLVIGLSTHEIQQCFWRGT